MVEFSRHGNFNLPWRRAESPLRDDGRELPADCLDEPDARRGPRAEVRRVSKLFEVQGTRGEGARPNDDWRQRRARRGSSGGIPLPDTQRSAEPERTNPGAGGERGNNVLDGYAAAVPGGFDGELVALFDVLDEFEFAL